MGSSFLCNFICTCTPHAHRGSVLHTYTSGSKCTELIKRQKANIQQLIYYYHRRECLLSDLFYIRLIFIYALSAMVITFTFLSTMYFSSFYQFFLFLFLSFFCFFSSILFVFGLNGQLLFSLVLIFSSHILCYSLPVNYCLSDGINGLLILNSSSNAFLQLQWIASTIQIGVEKHSKVPKLMGIYFSLSFQNVRSCLIQRVLMKSSTMKFDSQLLINS